MASIHVSNQVGVRNDMGRFIADIEAAAPKLIQASLNAGEEVAIANTNVDTGRLAGSFFTRLVSRTQGHLGNPVPYAKWQDEGGDPHEQEGWVSFFWEKRGRMWNPGNNLINHPGNDGTGFMLKGYNAAKAFAKANMAAFYPG